MYIFRKIKEYFFSEIEEDLLEEALEYLDYNERKIFENMSKYDKFHSLKVYEKLKNSRIGKEKIYLKLALLHDCGKGNIGIIKRILHKLGLKTELKNHSDFGMKKLENINKDLAILIKNHHNKNYSHEMKIFQKCDDES